MQHQLTYKGYSVYCDHYLYYLGLNPTVKYISFQDVKNEIDRIEKTLEENIVNIREIIKRKPLS